MFRRITCYDQNSEFPCLPTTPANTTLDQLGFVSGGERIRPLLLDIIDVSLLLLLPSQRQRFDFYCRVCFTEVRICPPTTNMAIIHSHSGLECLWRVVTVCQSCKPQKLWGKLKNSFCSTNERYRFWTVMAPRRIKHSLSHCLNPIQFFGLSQIFKCMSSGTRGRRPRRH